jgi:hypothetical protein
MNSRLALLACLVAVGSASPCLAAEYWLSPAGADDALGTKAQPWRSVQKANASLQPGDTAIFTVGDYPGTIATANSGSADAPITYRSAERWAAVLVGEGSAFAVAPAGKSHLRIEDFRISVGDRGGWVEANACDHLTIRGCYTAPRQQ